MMSSYPFKRTCKEVSALLIAREDRELPLQERVALRLHLAMCQALDRVPARIYSEVTRDLKAVLGLLSFDG